MNRNWVVIAAFNIHIDLIYRAGNIRRGGGPYQEDLVITAVSMNVNKKLGRFKQWGKERMGGEVKTDTTEEFKSLEVEMQLRCAGTYVLQDGLTMTY